MPGVDRFQIPHHGSRRNLSTKILGRWLGPTMAGCPTAGGESFTAIVSAGEDDEDHLRKSVLRGFIHRGGAVKSTNGKAIRTSHNAPERKGWTATPSMDYPEDQES